ncbi:MAG: molybdopterin converting factor subunit 1 [Gemmatimonadota bacterium]|nr:molybdopterin converting factor subunit 1 [Gemmatimonadota bacterium]
MDHFEVRLFASFADLFGAPHLNLALPRGATVEQLTSAIQALPGGVRLPPKLVVAVNHEYVPPQTVINAGDEIALIPPVAGG